MKQKGFIHLFLILIILLILIGAAFFGLVSLNIIKNPFQNLPFIGQIGNKSAQVEMKTEYENPFDKNTQYVNPFEEYKNPFIVK